jgi:hypothetical protein
MSVAGRGRELLKCIMGQYHISEHNFVCCINRLWKMKNGDGEEKEKREHLHMRM